MKKNIGIYTNRNKDKDLVVTSKIVSLLVREKFNVYLHSDIVSIAPECPSFNENDKKLFDILLTVGGDGTILRIATYCAEHDIAILGINLGTVGFLTEVELDSLNLIPKILTEKEFLYEKRSLLCVNHNGKTSYALNEIVLTRDFSDRMIALGVYVNDKLADKYYCDGFIVSSPTGSTAYSLSAGGCVLSPDVKAMSILPINSHSLHSRPIIVSDEATVKISVLSAGKSCAVIADGQTVGKIKTQDELSVSTAKKQLSFLRLNKSNFYEKLLSKLNIWSVTQK
ncbi:MAG: NAD(+)/NADH kinase [Clostridia bacterium]|nr:NAD(+)/NADH kinase [Clostridia bacterium]